MGCFLACFGLSKKRRRRRKPIHSEDHVGRGKYEPLDNSSQLDLEIAQDSSTSTSSLSKKQSSAKTRKKVRFNLNVQTYEPIPIADAYFSESDKEEDKRRPEDETPRLDPSPTLPNKGGSTASTGAVYSENYRYQNCRDSSDEEEELLYDDSDFELEDEDDDIGSDDNIDFYGNMQDSRMSQKQVPLQITSSVSSSMKEQVSLWRSDLDKTENLISHHSMSVLETKTLNTSENARCRTQYVDSVLNPVENLMQWKRIKGNATPVKHQQKENLELEKKFSTPFSLNASFSPPASSLGSNSVASKPFHSVNTSLSNWLVSPDTVPSENAPVSKSSTILFRTV
ncbi:uncharacterized protein LOC115728076 [Rhodamnia argentea]|uniref:Uncharacterized protein LOC115728076 n=1 Tax=Rhodamnia argentea TaxID=178133 RepID=A0A8B8MVX9_9MYRT|nr:uncharacterized protein LOC115728076 [Rhodamnia argentea]